MILRNTEMKNSNVLLEDYYSNQNVTDFRSNLLI